MSALLPLLLIVLKFELHYDFVVVFVSCIMNGKQVEVLIFLRFA